MDAWVEGDGGAQRAGEGLEGGLDDVVRVGAVELADVGVDARVRAYALEELRRERLRFFDS